MNHLFSFKNVCREKMYAIVVGAKTVKDAKMQLNQDKKWQYEGETSITSKSNAYDADLYFVN